MSKEILIDQTSHVAKAFAGAGIVGGSTYVTVSTVAEHFNVSEATALAGLAAACMTALYFFLMSVLTFLKIVKAVNGHKP